MPALACVHIASAQAPHPDSSDAGRRARLLTAFDGTTGEPVAQADVIDVRSGARARTSSAGTVSLSFLPAGGSVVRIRKLGFEPMTVRIAAGPSDTVPVAVLLKRVAELPAVGTMDSARRPVSPPIRGFELRYRTRDAVYFMSEAEIRKEEGRHPLSESLKSHFPDINILGDSHGATLLEQSARCTSGGPPDVYVDGVMVALSKPVDLTQFKLSDLAGIEYYPIKAVSPVEYNATTNACGVLLLWSRE